MHPNAQILTTLYQAFQHKDYATMTACYHPQAVFRDAVFDLRGSQIGAMWHMFCQADDLTIDVGNITATDHDGWAHWEASYTFSLTGRKVHNRIQSHMEFADGTILRQDDTFNFWRWSRQAFGLRGIVLGWTPVLQTRVQQAARTRLARFMAAHPQYQQ
ncbi:MAG TPA: nuclear transport factor 2 family protein [Herpetosiphonaceae bacterium]